MKKLTIIIAIISMVLQQVPAQTVRQRPSTTNNQIHEAGLRPMATKVTVGSLHKNGLRRPTKHPGKETLISLIEKHNANTVKIAEESNVTQQTVSSWIRQDPELKALAKKLRLQRKGKQSGKIIRKIVIRERTRNIAILSAA